MAYTGPYRRWDVFWADLEPHRGSEQAGDRRPVLVESNDDFNRRFPALTVVALTKLEGKTRRIYPSEVILPPSAVGNDYTPLAQTFQIRTISPERLLARAGHLDDEISQEKVELALIAHLGIALEED
jgi:mRNA interferase MazF